MNGVVIQNLVVDLISKHNEIALCSNVCNLTQNFAAIHSTRWVIRVDHNYGARAICDLRTNVVKVWIPTVVFVAQIMHGIAASKAGAGRP